MTPVTPVIAVSGAADITPGATTPVTIRLPPTPTPVDLARNRARTRRTVLGCTSCPLHAVTSDGPLPLEVGAGTRSRPAAYAVVGEGPTAEEDGRGQLYVGAAGRLLRGVMREAGVDIERGVWMNTTCCVPKDKKGGKVRGVSDDEQKACRGNLMAGLEASGARCVMLVGAKAVHTWRPDLQVTKTNGYAYVWHLPWGDVMVMPVIHPGGVLRAKGDGGLAEHLDVAVELFGEMVNDSLNWGVENDYDRTSPTDWLSDRCVVCGRWMDNMDPDGVGYCAVHWKDHQYDHRRGAEGQVRIRGGRRKPVRKGKNTDPAQGSLDGTA